MKNLILSWLIIIGSVPLLAQENEEMKIDSLTLVLTGEWKFIEVIDQDGQHIESIGKELNGSPIGNQIKLKASGPDIILKKNGTYELEFTPQNTDKGKWYLETSDTLIFQLVSKKGTRDYNKLKSAAEMFEKELRYDKKGNIIENIPSVIIQLEADKMLMKYETDFIQVYKRIK